MNAWFASLTAVLGVSFFSFTGALFIVLSQKNLQRVLLFLVSFAVGGLWGNAMFHLLPEAVERAGFNLEISLSIFAGFLSFFILEKFICWRHCHIPTSKTHLHPLVFMNLLGDGLHNFLDGAVIAGSFLVSFPLGISTTLAVILHEIPQEIGDLGVLLYGGFSRKKALAFNFLSALMAILGALLVLILDQKVSGLPQFLIPFTTGGFLYIAGSDLIPEIHKETNFKKSLIQFLSLILGTGIMVFLKF